MFAVTTTTNFFWKRVLDECDLYDAGSKGRKAWEMVSFGLSQPNYYPINLKIAQELVNALNHLKKKDDDEKLWKKVAITMVKLSRTDYWSQIDILGTNFIEMYCDVYFTRTYGTPLLDTYNASEVRTFLGSEPHILEEVKGLPDYSDYVEYVRLKINPEYDSGWLPDLYNDLKDVPQSGRLTKRARPT